jgi:Kef-type K+ transport systems, predicted NAD-binding component
MSIPVILADASFRATLQSSNINTATAVLAVTSNDATNLEIALKAKALAPNIPVIVNNYFTQIVYIVRQFL